MERMAQRGHEVRVIDYQIGWMKELHSGFVSPKMIKEHVYKIIPPGVTVIRPQIIRLPILSYLSLLVSHRLAIEREIHNFHPDVIIGFGLLNARMAIHQGNKHNIPFIYYVIDELHRLVPEELLQPMAKYVEKGNLKYANTIITINEGLNDYCVQMGSDPKNTVLIRAGVDFNRFSHADGSDIRKRFGFTEKDTVMFFMGWLYTFSGLDEVIKEMALSDNKNLKMLIIGKGELWGRLHDIRDKEGLNDRLVIEGWKPYEEVPNYLAAADICLLPAKKSKIMENIVPIKMYEYLAAGKTVLATDLSGIRKEFGEGNGVLYTNESEDPVRLALRLINEDRVKDEGKKGQEFVRNNDWSGLTLRFEQTLLELSRTNKPSSSENR
jgi:glycosyltransferase involved in cell wall biosynthesis